MLVKDKNRTTTDFLQFLKELNTVASRGCNRAVKSCLKCYHEWLHQGDERESVFEAVNVKNNDEGYNLIDL